jgi:hypothetical protein
MFGLLVRIVLGILLFRFLGGLLRAVGGGPPLKPGAPPDPRVRDASRAPKPLVDRASAIDVPFTEEPRES